MLLTDSHNPHDIFLMDVNEIRMCMPHHAWIAIMRQEKIPISQLAWLMFIQSILWSHISMFWPHIWMLKLKWSPNRKPQPHDHRKYLPLDGRSYRSDGIQRPVAFRFHTMGPAMPLFNCVRGKKLMVDRIFHTILNIFEMMDGKQWVHHFVV